jgi:hypothetical protein
MLSLLRRLVRIVKPDPAVIQLLACIDAIRREIPAELRIEADPLLNSLTRTVRFKWSEGELSEFKHIASFGEPPEGFVYNHLVQECANELESGMHHVYRGVLGFRGQAYNRLFDYAIRAAIARGLYTEAWAEDNLRAPVRSGIANVG